MANIKHMRKYLPLPFENGKCLSFIYALVFCFALIPYVSCFHSFHVLNLSLSVSIKSPVEN